MATKKVTTKTQQAPRGRALGALQKGAKTAFDRMLTSIGVERYNSWMGSWSGLEQLVLHDHEEHSQLDVKQLAYGSRLKSQEARALDKIEIRRDVAAFSNAGGGIIVLGIRENKPGERWTLVGIDDPASAAGFARESLAQLVEPRLSTDEELLIRSYHSPEDRSRGVVVIVVGKHPPGRPRSVDVERKLEFWIREGSSKRPMTYRQIEEQFRSNEDAEKQRKIDIDGEVAVAAIRFKLEAFPDPEQALACIEELFRFTKRPFGKPLALPVVQAASAIIDDPRRSYSPALVNRTFSLIFEALPIFSLNSRQNRALDDSDLDALRAAAQVAHNLIYDASRRSKEMSLLSIGGALLHRLLRFAMWNDLIELKSELEAAFEDRIKWARLDLPPVAAQLLEFYRDAALAKKNTPKMSIDVGRYAFRHSPE